jgi:membrane complex biogenesis BtpA family protein
LNRFAHYFPTRPAVIGMLALPPSPGYASFRSIELHIERALADLDALQGGGVDALLVENDFDQPHTLLGAPEVIAAMTRITREVVARARQPVGVQVLLNDWRATLAIAAMTGAQFVRLDFFVDRVRIAAGLIEPDAAAVVAYRRSLRAEHILLLTDIQVKYSQPAGGPKPIALSARQAAEAGADAVVVTGARTGLGPAVDDLRDAHAAQLPVLIGSGLTPANAATLLAHADGAIVGTALRSGPGPDHPLDIERVRAVVEQARR